MSIYVAPYNLDRGVFASKHFRPGEEVLHFDGPRIGLAQALAKGPAHCNPLQLGIGLYIDLTEPSVYLNHSCDPNAGVMRDTALVAVRNIRPGEEIRFDYSTTMGDGTWEMDCRCGAANCRGIVRDFEHLPAPLRHQFLQRGIVSSYLVRRLTTYPPRKNSMDAWSMDKPSNIPTSRVAA